MAAVAKISMPDNPAPSLLVAAERLSVLAARMGAEGDTGLAEHLIEMAYDAIDRYQAPLWLKQARD